MLVACSDSGAVSTDETQEGVGRSSATTSETDEDLARANEGTAAGQNPFLHLNVHLIPRYTGDTKDPRGGVRWVIPDRANYWSQR